MKRIFLLIALLCTPAAFGEGTVSILDGVSALDIFNINMDADQAIVITATGRAITTGTIRIEQTPGTENTRAIAINLNTNSFADSHGIVVDIIATGLAAGEIATAFDALLDTDTSTGGDVHGIECSIAGVGSAAAECLHANIGVDPIEQFAGTLGNLEQAHTESGGFFTDITAAAASTSVDATMFAADDDALFMGDAAVFGALEFNLETDADGTGIIPVFEFSDGAGGWTVFTPEDDTNGMRLTGDVIWEAVNLTGWATDPTPPALGSVAFDSGTTGTVSGITVNSVEIMSGGEGFDTSLAITAANVAANIVANTSSPNYTAFISSSTTVMIQAIATGTGVNGFVVTSSNSGNMSLTDTNMAGGTADKFQIRITRTADTLVTPPVEDTIQVAATTTFSWSKEADIVVNGIETIGSDGTFVGDVCGTSPAIVGSDTAGKITVGSTSTTSCAFTFSTAYTNAPACVAAGDNSAVTYANTSTTTILTVTSSADMASDVLSFICIGL